jgi:hypothetical protein
MIGTFNRAIFYLSKKSFWDKNVRNNLQDYTERGEGKSLLVILGGESEMGC